MFAFFAAMLGSLRFRNVVTVTIAVVSAVAMTAFGQSPSEGPGTPPAAKDAAAKENPPKENPPRTSSGKTATKRTGKPDDAENNEAPGSGESTDKQGRRIVRKTAKDWAKVLTPSQFKIMRKKGTERAFSGKYWDHHGDGVYSCAGCGEPLFDSKTKFESGTGWPSFTAPAGEDALVSEVDRSDGMVRTEVICRCCEAHLGHVFGDGPMPTGLRYCINSETLKFSKRNESEPKSKKAPAAKADAPRGKTPDSTGSEKTKPEKTTPEKTTPPAGD